MFSLSQNEFLNALGLSVLSSLWQMGLLWLVYTLASSWFFRNRHAQKSLLATFMLFMGFAWFLVTLSLHLFSGSSPDLVPFSPILTGISGSEKFSLILRQTLPAAALAYLFLLGFPLFRLLKNYHYLIFIRENGLKKIGVEWRILTMTYSALLGIKKHVSVWLSEFVTSPVTIGFLKPVILVPVAAVNNLTTSQLEALLLHELAHIRRFDYLLNFIIKGIRSLLYFNPFVKFFTESIEREREKSCDELVIRHQNDPQVYAAALLQLEKSAHPVLPLLLAASGSKFELLHRIEMILGVNKKPVFSINKLAGIFTGLIFIIMLNAILHFKKPADKNPAAVSLSHISSPFFPQVQELVPLSDLAGKDMTKLPAPAVKSNSSGITRGNNTAASGTRNVETFAVAAAFSTPEPVLGEFRQVSYKHPVPPTALKHYQEAQVKKAADDSRKILEVTQWKATEKTMADALTKSEKEKIRQLQQKAFENYDWKILENKIRQSYNYLDWENINQALENSTHQIKLDSLQTCYSDMAGQIETLIRNMKENRQTCIPDTDLTLSFLEEKSRQLQYQLKYINALQSRKIIRL